MSQVQNPAPKADDPPVGVIEQVHGPVVDLACRVLLPLHQAVYAALDHERYVFEVHQHITGGRK